MAHYTNMLIILILGRVNCDVRTAARGGHTAIDKFTEFSGKGILEFRKYVPDIFFNEVVVVQENKADTIYIYIYIYSCGCHGSFI